MLLRPGMSKFPRVTLVLMTQLLAFIPVALCRRKAALNIEMLPSPRYSCYFYHSLEQMYKPAAHYGMCGRACLPFTYTVQCNSRRALESRSTKVRVRQIGVTGRIN
ncbi:hypothetical protein F5884DRAFT_792836 [Xylogone sp. PMI_703]|nr:hypothetical protein F5884DRAFT_792836 [Xylogone sp. PMI_703]